MTKKMFCYLGKVVDEVVVGKRTGFFFFFFIGRQCRYVDNSTNFQK